jgi:hypothetical protein
VGSYEILVWLIRTSGSQYAAPRQHLGVEPLGDLRRGRIAVTAIALATMS